MKPIRAEWEVGKDTWGRQIKLIYETVSGKPGWTIHAVAANQRDEDLRIFGLPEQVILLMADVVRSTAARPE
jgi:hypothetical protein